MHDGVTIRRRTPRRNVNVSLTQQSTTTEKRRSTSQRRARESLRRASAILQQREQKEEQRQRQRKRIKARVKFQSIAEYVRIRPLKDKQPGHVRMPSDTRPSRTSPADKPLRMRSASRSTQQRVAKVARDSESTDHTEIITKEEVTPKQRMQRRLTRRQTLVISGPLLSPEEIAEAEAIVMQRTNETTTKEEGRPTPLRRAQLPKAESVANPPARSRMLLRSHVREKAISSESSDEKPKIITSSITKRRPRKAAPVEKARAPVDSLSDQSAVEDGVESANRLRSGEENRRPMMLKLDDDPPETLSKKAQKEKRRSVLDYMAEWESGSSDKSITEESPLTNSEGMTSSIDQGNMTDEDPPENPYRCE